MPIIASGLKGEGGFFFMFYRFYTKTTCEKLFSYIVHV